MPQDTPFTLPKRLPDAEKLKEKEVYIAMSLGYRLGILFGTILGPFGFHFRIDFATILG